MSATILQAHAGDRAANLEAIAAQLDRLGALALPRALFGRESQGQSEIAHQLRGFAEQLRIIALEVRVIQREVIAPMQCSCDEEFGRDSQCPRSSLSHALDAERERARRG